MSVTYRHPRPALTVDAVVLGFAEGRLFVLLIERGKPPFEGCWAFPGGFVEVDEPLEEAARRELREETGLSGVYLEQLRAFGRPDRDPREHVVSIAWYALVNRHDHRAEAATDARDARWFPVRETPDLAFDHAEILSLALERLKEKVRYHPVGFELLPEKFTLTQLQQLYEAVLEQELDKRNFRKKVLGLGLLEELSEWEKNVGRRRARLYRFDRAKYDELARRGFEFRI